MRGLHRPAQHGQQGGGAEPDPLGRRRDRGQRRDRLQDRAQQGVAGPYRVEPELLGAGGEADDVARAVARSPLGQAGRQDHAPADVIGHGGSVGDRPCWRQFPAGNRAAPWSAARTPTVEFAQELRARRTRRRLSQLELAVRAGTTQRHVSFMESGRSAPGRAMVVRLAESLELPLRERNDLLLAAGFAPAFPESRMDAEALGAVRAALEQVLVGHLPYPAIIAGPSGDLVAANSAAELLAD